MFSSLKTVAFSGIAVEEVEVQVHFAQGQPNLSIVGLANKSVSEAKDRVRSAIFINGIIFTA